MKATKAAKRLADVEQSLIKVIERYPVDEHGLRELLEEAKSRIVDARKVVGSQSDSSKLNGNGSKPTQSAKHSASAAKKGTASQSTRKRKA